MASSDIYELKEQIRTLILNINNTKKENKQINNTLTNLNNKNNLLKTEINILNSLDAVRFHVNNNNNSITFNSSQIDNNNNNNEENSFDKKFLEENLKLELTILNTELRLNLPKLEKEVLEYEDNYKLSCKILKNEQERKLNLSIKPEELIQNEINELIEKKRKIEDVTDKLIREFLDKKRNLNNIVNQKRKQLLSLEDDYDYQTDRSRRLKKTLLIEQARLDHLIIQHIQLRERLQPYHNSHGWETEAFLSYTGSISNSIRITQIPEVLENWIIPLGLIGIQPSEPTKVSPRNGKEKKVSKYNQIAASSISELIEKGLKVMRYDHKIELNYEEFLLFCEYILSCQQVQLDR